MSCLCINAFSQIAVVHCKKIWAKAATLRQTDIDFEIKLHPVEEIYPNDLKENDVDVVTIGQYLQPSKKHLPVKEFITPDQFKKYETIGLEMGFRHVESGALVRSSYKAQKHIN